ncbi:chromosome alignment-maintaining phosphoprotein 1-like [Pan paniscus]|uniref:chromosome alignment-maintaining phosphoprotein 1-like n=1 Tax=Pan paniscus TaxID=9597 RepID=UPI00300762CD
MAFLGPYPMSLQSPQMRLLPHNSLHRHSSIVTMASLDPAPASQPSLQALNFLKSTSPGPAHASLQPLQAQLLHLGGPSRPSLCLPSASTVPTSASQQILHAQHLPHCGPPKPSSQPFSSFYTRSSRLPVASSGPWESFLTTAFPGPVFPFRRPLRAQNLLKSASPDPLAPSGRPLWAQLFFLVASPGPTPASQQPLWTQCLPISWRPWSAHSFLKPSSPGPGQASQWPLQDELLPSNGISRPQMVSGRWAPPRQAWVSRRPPQAQVVLKSASLGPASQQVSKLFWLNSCPAPNRLCRPRTFSSQALRAHFLPPGGLYRPSTGWRTASAGPALASQGPLQAQLLPPWRPPGAKSLPASQQPACGPAPPSRWPVDAQLMTLAPCPEA